MVPALRLSHATLDARDIDRSIEYFRDTNGLTLVERSSANAIWATENGRVSVILRAGSHANLSALTFETAMSVKDAAEKLGSIGVRCQVQSDPFPGVRQSVNFEDPCGTRIELYCGPDAAFDKDRGGGVKPLKLGHVARLCPDITTLVTFYEQVLGFRVSDWISDYFVFLRCDSDHHAINFFRGDKPGLHHMAFELKDMAHMQSACDLLARSRIQLGWGPLRQSAGHNMAVYHRSDDDHVIEFYCELDQMKNELLGYFDPRPWHQDCPQRPKVWDPSAWQAGWGTPPAPHFGRTPKGEKANRS
jgi:catechol 2,3-dioxygenase-like lactoylglutathione lyase family enzyme